MGEIKDKVQGTAKDLKGKVTGSKSEKMKGKVLKTRGAARGKAKDLVNDLKDAAYGGEDSGPTVDSGTMAPTRERG